MHIDDIFEPVPVKDDMPLTDEQRDVFDAAVHYARHGGQPYFSFEGLAGTGKTVVLCALARRFPGSLLATLTGRAASNLRRKSGIAAGTIHSALYKLEREVIKPNAPSELVWSRIHDTDALRGGLILLDEHSTISDEIGRDIVDTGARIIAAGDPGQLPPVSGRPFFTEASATLTTIHRQALESGIIRQAHRVRAGHRYEADGPDFQVGSYASDEVILGADVVLCWKNATRHLLNARVRHLRGLTGMTPRRTETVMCLKNNADAGVFNGATYELLEDYVPHSRRIAVNVDGFPTEIEFACFEGIDDQYHQYDNRNIRFTFGYASTTHKAQGSEWDRVLLFDEYNASEDRARWIYTGITRAQQTIIVIRT